MADDAVMDLDSELSSLSDDDNDGQISNNRSGRSRKDGERVENGQTRWKRAARQTTVQNSARPAKRQKRTAPSTNGLDSGMAAIDESVGDTDEDLSTDENDYVDDVVEEQDDNDEDFQGPAQPKKTRAQVSNPRRKLSSKANGAGRQARSTTEAARYADGDEDDHEVAQAARAARARGDDFGVAGDNNLFNAIKDGGRDLQTAVEDWTAEYQADEDSRGQALADLVNCFLRCCACNLTVDLHEAQDIDGITGKLEDIQNEFAKVTQASYPLISRTKTYKKFRANLHDFFLSMAKATHQCDVLYDDIFSETLQGWLVAASSSKLRAFRHTSTALLMIWLEVLCEVNQIVLKDSSIVQRQRDAEGKRRGNADKARTKDIEKRIKDYHAKKVKLESYLRDIFDAVFTHRYRDAEPAIRIECIRSLGVFMRTLPTYWLEGSYLRYFGWMLTDTNKDVRAESLCSLLPLYDANQFITSMQHFTERFRERLLEMSTSEPELNVRLKAIVTVCAIDRHELLDEDMCDELGCLLFDAEPKVRKAVAAFIQHRLQESVKDRETHISALSLVNRQQATSTSRTAWSEAEDAETVKQQLGLQCFVKLLQQLSLTLHDKLAHDASDMSKGSNDAANKDSAFNAASGAFDVDRLQHVVAAIWHDVDLLQNWQSILQYLLLDHTAHASDSVDHSEVVADQMRLQESEETLLLGILICAIRQTRTDLDKLDASRDEDAITEGQGLIARSLIEALPKLFSKYQSDAVRSGLVLHLPQCMQLNYYLETRQITAYEGLWNTVSKHVLRSSTYVFAAAVDAVRAMCAADELNSTNSEKLANLKMACVTSFQSVAEDHNLEHAHLEGSHLIELTKSLHAVTALAKIWNIVDLLDPTGSDTSKSVLQHTSALIDRGLLGQAEDDQLITHALELQYLYVLWKFAMLQSDDTTPDVVLSHRTQLVEKCTELALDSDLSVSLKIKRAAFRTLLEVSLICRHRRAATRDPRDAIALSVQTQYQCAGFIQAEIERYSAELSKDADNDLLQETMERDDAERPADLAPEGSSVATTATQCAHQAALHEMIAVFSRSLCASTLDLHHASVILAHFGRFDAFYDECCKMLAAAMKYHGLKLGHSEIVASIVVATLESAVDTYLKCKSQSDATLTALARMLANHIIARSKGFGITDRLDEKSLLEIHTASITFVTGRIANLQRQERHASRTKALQLYKGLALLMNGLSGKEAATIHSHLIRTMDDNVVDTSPLATSWEPYMSYEKKLIALMAKDNTVKAAARKKAKLANVNSDQQAVDNDELAASRELVATAKKRMRAKTAARSNKLHASQGSDVADIAVIPQRRSNRSSLNLRGLATYADRVNSDSEGDGEQAFARPFDPASQQQSTVPSSSRDEFSGSASPAEPSSQTLPARKSSQASQTNAQSPGSRRSEMPHAGGIPDNDSLADIPDSPPEHPDSWMEM